MRSTMRALFVLSPLLVVSCSSGSDFSSAPAPANVRGNWTGSVQNQSSSCPGTFNVGASVAIDVTVTQDAGTAVSLKLTGAGGVTASLALGSDTFSGSINVDVVDATLLGSTVQKDGACNYTWKATLHAKVAGDSMSGTVIYTPQPIDAASCTAIASCSRQQSFNVTKVKPPV